MDRKKFWQIVLLGTLLSAIFTALWNYSATFSMLRSLLSTIILPSFTGLCIAFIISIPSRFFAKRLSFLSERFAKVSSVLLSIFLIVLVVVLIAMFVLPELLNAVKLLFSSIQLFSEDVSSYLSSDKEKNEMAVLLARYLNDNIDAIENWLTVTLKNITPSLISGTLGIVFSTISSIISFFISFVIAIYFIVSEKMLRRHISILSERVLGRERTTSITEIVHIASSTFRKFVVAQCLEAIIIGALCTGGMLLFRLPYALMIGSLTGVTALIPVYGAFIGAACGTFIIAVVSPLKGVLFLLFIIVLQQLEGNLIYPRVVGSSLGLPSVYTFLAVTIAGALFGLVGMLFAVPIASVCYTLIRERNTSRSIA